MSVTTLAIAAFATWEIIEIWHHSALFASWRARIELWDGRVTGKLNQLLGCPFCMAPWTALVCLLLLMLPILWIIPTVFASARAANLLNDYFHRICRTPYQYDRLDTPQDANPESAETSDHKKS